MKLLFRIFPIIFFFTLSLVIIFPLLPPGFILTLDTIPTPVFHLAPLGSNNFLLSFIMKTGSIFIASYNVQKLFFFLIFFLSGISMYFFVPSRYPLARWFAGIFYVINPFVYERAVAGQLGLLLAYAVFPLFLRTLFCILENPKAGNTVLLSFVTAIIINASLHFFFLEILFSLIIVPLYLVLQKKNPLHYKRVFALFVSIAIIFNLNLLTGLLVRNNTISGDLSSFNKEDMIAFQSFPDPNFGLLFNLLSGYGFWTEATEYFVNQKNIIFYWPLLSLVFLGLSLYGLLKYLGEDKKNYPLAVSLVGIFSISLMLASGVAINGLKNIFFFLYEKVPFLIGLREPQKLVSMVMLFLAFFGGVGLEYLLKKYKKLRLLLLLPFLALPFIYSPAIFGSFWGQLKPVFYPDAWTVVNETLDKDHDEYLTLFFPWHQYLRFNFNNNLVVANPAPSYFTKPILSSRNYETASLYSHDERPEALHIEGLLRMEKYHVNLFNEAASPPKNFGEAVAPINVKYLILAKDDDWKTYNFLDKSPDLRKIYDAPEIALYLNESWKKME